MTNTYFRGLSVPEAVHVEHWADNSISVYVATTAHTWDTWTADAQAIRRQLGEVYNRAIGGYIYTGGVKLRAEPKYLARPYLPGCWEPLVNVVVDTPPEWERAKSEALTACGIATVEARQHKPFSRPETIASPKGAERGDPPADGGGDQAAGGRQGGRKNASYAWAKYDNA